MLDPPQKVIDSIVVATVRPKPETSVSYKAKASVASHRIVQGLSERVVGNVNHKVLMEDAAPAEATAGSLYEPMPGGDSVDGGMRKRLAEGDLRKAEDVQAQDE